METYKHIEFGCNEDNNIHIPHRWPLSYYEEALLKIVDKFFED